MRKILICCILCAVAVTASSQSAAAPAERADTTAAADTSRMDDVSEKGWFMALSGSASMGCVTFRSWADREKKLINGMGSIEGGYRFSPLFSLSLIASHGGVSLRAMSCCNYYLTPQWERYETDEPPTPDSWRYYDLISRTNMFQLSVQPSFNLLAIFKRLRDCRWSFEVSPQIGVARTRTTLSGDNVSGDYVSLRQKTADWHLGLGGDLAIGYDISPRFTLELFGGITFFNGERYDYVPRHVHTENRIWDMGLKAVMNFARREAVRSETAAPAAAVPDKEYIDRVIADAVAREREKNFREKDSLSSALAASSAELAKAKDEMAVLMAVEAEEETPSESIATLQYWTLVNFSIDKWDISTREKINILSASQLIKSTPDHKFRVSGFADKQTANAEHNMMLSKRRAAEVAKCLVEEFGVNPDQLVVDFLGGVDYMYFGDKQCSRSVLIQIINDTEPLLKSEE